MNEVVTTSTSGLPTCPYCGSYHQTVCDRVEEIEYHKSGTVKRVRLRSAQQDAPSWEPYRFDPNTIQVTYTAGDGDATRVTEALRSWNARHGNALVWS